MSKHQLTKRIGIEKVDFNGKVYNKYIMEILQKISTDSANVLGFGHSLVRSKNLAWVLNKIKLVFLKPISINEEITFYTWPIAPKHYIAERDYLAKNAQGETVLRGTSVWNLIDLTKRSLTSTDLISDIYVDYISERALEDRDFLRVRFNENFIHAYSKQVKLSEIDINNHVNNTFYLNYSLDCLSLEDYNKGIKEVQIRFNQELVLKDEFDVYFYKENNCYYVIGKKLDKEVFSTLIVLNE